MREIKFRGKRKDNGEWVEGDLNQHDVHHGTAILQHGVINNAVIPETVGQFTGLQDKNGKEIYEGDILKTPKGNICLVQFGTVSHTKNGELFQCSGWIGKNMKNGYSDFLDETITQGEIIGNSINNPELVNN